MLIKIPRGWEIPEREAISERAYMNRRQLLAAAGFLSMERLAHGAAAKSPYPAKLNPEYTLDRPLTPEFAATGYNNFYEFDAEDKTAVKNLVGNFVVSPWKIEVTGLVEKPVTLDIDDIVNNYPLEERTYRFRCVERWAMAVPWTGTPFSELVKRVNVLKTAQFVRFVSVARADQQPGIRRYKWYPFPFYEGLRMDEAMNPLTLLVTGLYGKPLPKQNGAPIRIICPWKYGYKSPKSIVRIEFVAKQPKSFWNDLQPEEYGFYSNVNPRKPHPRWSQAVEQLIPNMERRPTQLYNGYEKWVAGLYDGKEH
jgi:sulfoxide reductase catalytic subunit YedY